MLVIASELADMDTDYWHLRIQIIRLLHCTRLKFTDAAGNWVCSTGVNDRTLDVARFELRADWTGNSWLLMLPTEDVC
jgi:hypothetical protein